MKLNPEVYRCAATYLASAEGDISEDHYTLGCCAAIAQAAYDMCEFDDLLLYKREFAAMFKPSGQVPAHWWYSRSGQMTHKQQEQRFIALHLMAEMLS